MKTLHQLMSRCLAAVNLPRSWAVAAMTVTGLQCMSTLSRCTWHAPVDEAGMNLARSRLVVNAASRPSGCSCPQRTSRAPGWCAATGASTSRHMWRPAPRAVCTSWTSTRTPSSGRAGWLQWRPACPASTAPRWAPWHVPKHSKCRVHSSRPCRGLLQSPRAPCSTLHGLR
jgi:hypothetical protein